MLPPEMRSVDCEFHTPNPFTLVVEINLNSHPELRVQANASLWGQTLMDEYPKIASLLTQYQGDTLIIVASKDTL